MSKQRSADQIEIGAAAAAPAWRSFSFFDASQVRDHDDFARSPQALRNPHNVAGITLCPIRPPPLQSAVDTAHADVPSDAGPSSQAPPASQLRQPSLLVGTIDGQIQVLDPDTYVELAAWQAFSSPDASGRITHLSCDSRGRLVSLGEEDASRFPVLRIWDMRVGRLMDGGKRWVPKLLSEGKVQHGSRPHPVATISHTASLSFLSVALGDGTVLLLRGLDSTLMSASSSTAGLASSPSTRPAAAVALPKFKVVFQPSSSDLSAHEPVTALGFSESAHNATIQVAAQPGDGMQDAQAKQGSRGRKGLGPLPRQRPKKAIAGASAATQSDAELAAADKSPTSVHLFIVTLSRILRYIVVGKGAGSSPAILDDVGCALGCAAVIPSGSSRRRSNVPGGLAGKMVVARDEAIYVIGPEGREACYAYEGPKTSIHISASQVVIVTPPFTPSSASASATVRNFVAGRDHAQPSNFTPSSSAGRGSPMSAAGGPSGRRGLTEIAKVTIFDLDNKFVAYSGTFEGGVRETWVGPAGEIAVLGDNGSVTRLDEKALRAKLDILYRKSLFLLAVNMARSHAERASSPETRARVEALMADIFQRYGDHLYSKGDFEGAMAQYVKTIGHTQPSFVIRKFLDAQRITNLTIYLQELHARGMASSDHTTLLLNCYTKLKDVASLDRFIKRPPNAEQANRPGSPNLDLDDGVAGDTERDELPFDLGTAMRVCRQAGYYGHAAYLAKRYGEHDEYLKIQIEDANNFEDALAYIRGLSPAEAIRNMTQYGKLLLDQLPAKVTDLLIELCAGAFRPTFAGQQEQAAPAKDSVGRSAAAAYLSYLHVGSFNKSTSTGVENGGGNGTGTSTPSQLAVASNRNSMTGAEPYNVDGTRSRRQSVLPGIEEGTLTEIKDEAYPVPSPRTFFAHFIQHPAEFIRFLETVALARWGQSVNMDVHADSHDPLALRADLTGDAAEDEVTLALRELGMSADGDYYEDQEELDKKAIWNTLLELYLTSSKAAKPGEANVFGLDGAQRGQRREKALHLLEQHETLPYDVSHALMLCSVEKFTEGLVLLYERMGMYEDVLRFWMDASDEEEAKRDQNGGRGGDFASADDASCKVMAALQRYGSAKPHLYPIVLRYLVSTPEILSRHGDDLRSVLQHIEEHALMSPLEVVQALSRNGVASVGLVRAYLSRTILRERSDIEANEKATASLQASTAEKLAEVHALTSAERPQVFQMTRCSACGGQLDLPTVHFMCKHSFHQRCLGENETECLVCAQRMGAMRDWRREVEGLRGREDLFEAELDASKDGFETISTFFSKGLMGLAESAQLSSSSS